MRSDRRLPDPGGKDERFAAQMEALERAREERRAVRDQRDAEMAGTPMPPAEPGAVASRKGVKFTAAERAIVRRFAGEEPGASRAMIAARFEAETGREISLPTVGSILGPAAGRGWSPRMGRPPKFGDEDRDALRRIAAEEPGSSGTDLAARFEAETGREIDRNTARRIAETPAPDSTPDPKRKARSYQFVRRDEPKAVVDAGSVGEVIDMGVPAESRPSHRPEDVYDAMREIEAILSRLGRATRLRVLDWFRSGGGDA